jgi:hypothetical protein
MCSQGMGWGWGEGREERQGKRTKRADTLIGVGRGSDETEEKSALELDVVLAEQSGVRKEEQRKKRRGRGDIRKK